MDTDPAMNIGNATKWLTLLVYFLLTVLTVMSGWQQVQMVRVNDKFDTLPKEYVSKERYLCDRADFKTQLARINDKLDYLIKRASP